MNNKQRIIGAIVLALLCFTGAMPNASGDESGQAVTLTPAGEQLLQRYTARLDQLKKEVVAVLPTIDPQKQAEFLAARDAVAKVSALQEPESDMAAQKNKELQEAADAKALGAARLILADLDAFLAGDQLDDRLLELAILTHATPRGLAEFAQQGKEEQALLDELFADKLLMKEMLLSGGANGGEYGEAMQVFSAIKASSEKARERDTIFWRLALGTSLHQPWLKGKSKGGVYGLVFADHSTPEGQVARYQHYEKAYLDGELDPAFKDMNTWECRFITNDPYTNEELAWTRDMMRKYRPDHITIPDYKWRYVRIVKSDVPYCTPDMRPEEGTSTVQQIVAGGGKCGPRAFYGRTASRAFGIPARRSTQTGHAALNKWTPDGWVVCFGAWWSHNWCGPWGGLDFLLESQAREFPEQFIKVLRAQWIGDALGEEDVSIRHYGQGGGLWNALAFYHKRAVVEDAQIKALELAGGMKLGESDDLLGDEQGEELQIPEEDRTITINAEGVISIPAAACADSGSSTDRILFMKSFDSGTQVHYSRLGKRPELMRYDIEVPQDGKYLLSMRVSTVARAQTCLLRLNRRTLIDVELPFTLGDWQETKPIEVELKQGRNSLMFTCKTPNRGVSIKQFTLTPAKAASEPLPKQTDSQPEQTIGQSQAADRPVANAANQMTPDENE